MYGADRELVETRAGQLTIVLGVILAGIAGCTLLTAFEWFRSIVANLVR